MIFSIPLFVLVDRINVSLYWSNKPIIVLVMKCIQHAYHCIGRNNMHAINQSLYWSNRPIVVLVIKFTHPEAVALFEDGRRAYDLLPRVRVGL